MLTLHLVQILGIFFVHGISYRPSDLSLLKDFSKKISFEDFHNFEEIPSLCGLALAI